MVSRHGGKRLSFSRKTRTVEAEDRTAALLKAYDTYPGVIVYEDVKEIIVPGGN